MVEFLDHLGSFSATVLSIVQETNFKRHSIVQMCYTYIDDESTTGHLTPSIMIYNQGVLNMRRPRENSSSETNNGSFILSSLQNILNTRMNIILVLFYPPPPLPLL